MPDIVDDKPVEATDIRKVYYKDSMKIIHPSGVEVFVAKTEIISNITNMLTEMESSRQSILEALNDVQQIEKMGGI